MAAQTRSRRSARRPRTLPAAPTNTASLYLRLSRESTEEGTGLVTQEADLRALAEARGLSVVAVHTDDGESGALRSRPGLLAWLDDARKGRADHLLAYRLDRVSRGGHAALATFLDTIAGVDSDGEPVSSPVRFLSSADSLDSASPAWDVQVAVMGAIAKGERDAIRSRIVRSRRERRTRGRFLGGPAPYGTRSVDSPDGGRVLEADPEEAEALREALRRLQAGDTPARVSRWLTAHGPAPRRAKTWSRTVLLQALETEAVERLVWTPAERRAVREITTPTTPRTGAQTRHPARLLSGVLACSGCGSTLTLSRRGKAGPDVYRCSRRARGGECSGAIAVNADLLEGGLSAMWLDGWGALPETVVVREADETADRLAALEDAVEDAQTAVIAVRGAERLEALKTLERLEAERDALVAEPVSTLSRLETTGRTYADVWAEGTEEDRRDAILRTVGRLTIGPGQRGRRSFDSSRVLDSWRLDPTSDEWTAKEAEA